MFNKCQRRKGVGPVIVSAFMVVILLLGFNSFRLILIRATQHGDFIDDIQQADYEKELESITVLGKPFDDTDYFSLTVVNVGEIESTITWISVLDYITKEPIYGYEKIDPPINLKPEETSQPIKPSGWIFSDAYTYKGNPKYIVQIATSRGTVTNYPYPNPGRKPIKGETGHLIGGPFVFNFDSTSFLYTSSREHSPTPAWEIHDDETELTFLVRLKNNSEETVKLNGYSNMVIVIPKQPLSDFHESELNFYIVDEASTYDHIDAYSASDPLVINPDETITLKFASNNAFTSSFHVPTWPATGVLQGYGSGRNEPDTRNLVTTFLVLFWEYGESGEVLGQTIPFVTIYLPKYEP